MRTPILVFSPSVRACGCLFIVIPEKGEKRVMWRERTVDEGQMEREGKLHPDCLRAGPLDACEGLC